MTLDFTGKKVLVVGDVMLDQYAYYISRGLSPEAPVPDLLENDDHVENSLGGAANVAANLRDLGIETTLAGVLGEDEEAEIFTSLLEGINFIPFVDPNRPTTTKKRILASSKSHQPQQITRLTRESTETIPYQLEDKIVPELQERIQGADVLVFSDYNKGFLTHEITRKLKFSSQIPKIIDTKPKKIGFYNSSDTKGETWFKPNIPEAEQITGITYTNTEDEDGLLELGNGLFRAIYPTNVLFTLGSDGMILYTSREEYHHLPARRKGVTDVSGAGDTVSAGLAAALALGYSPLETANIANIAASVVVGKKGTATCSIDELIKAYEND